MRVIAVLTGVLYLYLVGVLIWGLLYIVFGDRWGWLFLVNSFAFYLFLPLPAVLLAGVLTSQIGLLLGFGAALLLWAYLFGWMLLPRSGATPGGPSLTVMTANLLGFNEQTEQVVAALCASDADVIGLQELNPTVAQAIQHELGQKYPYQRLKPYVKDPGMGVISRYPLRALDAQLPGDWIGQPQILLVDIPGASVLVLNMHAMAPRFGTMEWTIRERERQAATLADFVAGRAEPSIVFGDFNAGDLSRAYRTISGTLRDAWRAAGRGLGNTFPGADSTGSSRRIIAGILAPKWLVRIDYIFHSEHWQAEWARIGPWDGVSDHRPVMARLALRAPRLRPPK